MLRYCTLKVNTDNNSLFTGSPLGTFKDVVITQDSIKAWPTFAYKAVDIVLADCTIPAGLAGTLIYLNLTVFPLKSRTAFTRKASHIIHTGASIQAWVYEGGARGTSNTRVWFESKMKY